VIAITNSLTVNLTGETYSLRPDQETTLTVKVSANPAGGGVPSGTVDIVRGSTLLESQRLLPAGPTESAASLPLRASQLEQGPNTLTAVYSGNSIAPCCPISGPPVPVYGSSTSTPIIVTKKW
jgi:hypothetical protein